MDLVRFELTTSSMPFKKYQSLADSLPQNKRLSNRRRGLRWTPRGGFWGVWTPRGLPDSTRGWHVGCFPSARACGLLYLLSAEGDNYQFLYKDDAHRRHAEGVGPGVGQLRFLRSGVRLWRVSGRHGMERHNRVMAGARRKVLPPLADLELDWPHHPERAIAKFAADAAALLLAVDYPMRWLLRQGIGRHGLLQ